MLLMHGGFDFARTFDGFAPRLAAGGWRLELGSALILIGALTKSAQLPWHIWLPGAMSAPTLPSAIRPKEGSLPPTAPARITR